MKSEGADSAAPAAPSAQKVTIHISNLGKDATEDQLRDFISNKKLSVGGVSIPPNKTYAKVMFYVEAEADKAVKELDGADFNGHVIQAYRFRINHDKEANLFVKQIPLDVSEVDLKKRFEDFGKVLSIKLMVYENGASKGFGFVQLETPEEAQAAIAALHGKDWDGKELFVTIFKSQKEREAGIPQHNNLYIKGFSDKTSEADLKEVFAQCGEVTSVSIPDPTKQFGYVCYKNPEEAKKAIEELDQKVVKGHTI